MKKKLIAGIAVILILYFTLPRVVDSVKFSMAQQRTYDFVQSFSVDNVNYNMTEFAAQKYNGDTDLYLKFDEQTAAIFIQTLQAVPKESYLSAYDLDVDWPDRAEGRLHIMFTDERQHFCIFTIECGYIRFNTGNWDDEIDGISWAIDNEALYNLIEGYLITVKQLQLHELSSIVISADVDYENALRLFVQDIYPNYLLHEAPGSVRITDYKVINYNIRDIGDNKNIVLGTMMYAFVPQSWDSPNIWIGNVEWGVEGYEGMLIVSRNFSLSLREEGWVCRGISV